MITLKDILYKVAIEAVKGSTEIAIDKLDFDSRKIENNDVFIAIRGAISDGHAFIEKAINKIRAVRMFLERCSILFQEVN